MVKGANTIQWGEKKSLQQMLLGDQDSYMKKNELELPISHLISKKKIETD